MLFARDIKRHRLGSSGNQNVLRFDNRAFDIECVRSGKPRPPMVRIDALVVVTLLVFFGDRIGKAALEGQETRPLEAGIAFHALVFHAPCVVHRLRAANHHLLRVASSKGAGPAKGSEVHYRDAPSGGAHAHRGDHGGGSGSNDQKIVVLGHVHSFG